MIGGMERLLKDENRHNVEDDTTVNNWNTWISFGNTINKGGKL